MKISLGNRDALLISIAHYAISMIPPADRMETDQAVFDHLKAATGPTFSFQPKPWAADLPDGAAGIIGGLLIYIKDLPHPAPMCHQIILSNGTDRQHFIKFLCE